MSWDSWFKDGLRFECTGCGECCRTHGEYAYVYLSRRDVAAAAEFLGMTQVDFLNAYCAADEGDDVYLADTTGDCAFLDERGRCRIYPVRPKQCETWPFWSENMSQHTFEGPVSSCCEGVGRGRLYPQAEIKSICRARDRWYEEDDA